jgi:hypothetical protein
MIIEIDAHEIKHQSNTRMFVWNRDKPIKNKSK